MFFDIRLEGPLSIKLENRYFQAIFSLKTIGVMPSYFLK
jgi:hypothetical protein